MKTKNTTLNNFQKLLNEKNLTIEFKESNEKDFIFNINDKNNSLVFSLTLKDIEKFMFLNQLIN